MSRLFRYRKASAARVTPRPALRFVNPYMCVVVAIRWLSVALSKARKVPGGMYEEIVSILLRALWKRCRVARRRISGRAGLATAGVAAVWTMVAAVALEK
jgi:hypothetical protein